MTQGATNSPRQRVFVLEQDGCIGCQCCVIACRDLHDLPEGVSWRRVLAREEGTFPNVRVVYTSTSCKHCSEPACVEACPAGAIVKRSSDGAVVLQPSDCVACDVCLDACPHGSLQRDPGSGTVSKCDMCLDRLDRGEQPECVLACPMRVLHVEWMA